MFDPSRRPAALADGTTIGPHPFATGSTIGGSYKLRASSVVRNVSPLEVVFACTN